MSDTIHHLTIRGRVQGVGYRYWLEQQARVRGLEGWVRNRRDGKVEALFAGPPDVVSGMIVLCRRGPPSAALASLEGEAALAASPKMRPSGEPSSWLPTHLE